MTVSIQSYNKYLLRTYCVPGIVLLDAENRATDEIKTTGEEQYTDHK